MTRDESYVDFDPSIEHVRQLRARIDDDPDRRAQDCELDEAFSRWWTRSSDISVETFVRALAPVGPLDRFALVGVYEVADRDALHAALRRRCAESRRQLAEVVECWWHELRVPLRDPEERRDAARRRLDDILEDLGYA